MSAGTFVVVAAAARHFSVHSYTMSSDLDFTNNPNLPALQADLTGRTVLVVGSNVGIGFEAAKHFARMNPKRLIVTCRSEEKGVQTIEG